MESHNPRKIGMGVPQILGLLEQRCQKLGVPIFFCDTSVSPAELMYGRHLQSHLDTLHPDLSRKAWQTQEQQMWGHGVPAKPRHFQVGELVYEATWKGSGNSWLSLVHSVTLGWPKCS